MASTFSQLSASFARLSSLERRFIIWVLVVIFIVINLLFVRPHFSDLTRIRNRFAQANIKLKDYEKEISQMAFYQSSIDKMGGEGAAVLPEDQSVSFLTAVQNQAAQSGVAILANNRQAPRTNQFFVELGQALTTQSGEAQLVDFLYNLGAGNSQIRARALTVRPEMPQRQALTATMTLVASFQKKTPVKAAAGSKPASTPATNTPPASKPPAPVAVPAAKTNKAAGGTPATKPLTPPKK